MSVKYESETVNCLCCGSNRWHNFITASDLITHTGEVFNVVECDECRFKWTNPRPESKFIGQFYPESYGPYAIGKATLTRGGEGALKNLVVSGFHIPDANYAGKKVLEIGCSSGAFLKKIQELGAKTQGIEFSGYAADLARQKGLSIHTGSIDDFKSNEKYDFIFAWMVLEHLYDPKDSLRRMNELLAPGGKIVFSVPHIDSLDFRLFRRYWYALQVPSHISHFDKHSIRILLERAGFEVTLLVDQVSASNYVGSFKNFLNEKGIRVFDRCFDAFQNKKWAMPFRRLLDVLARVTCQSGRMTVWASPKRVQ